MFQTMAPAVIYLSTTPSRVATCETDVDELETRATSQDAAIASKVDINQGAENAGKVLGISDAGNVVAMENNNGGFGILPRFLVSSRIIPFEGGSTKKNNSDNWNFNKLSTTGERIATGNVLMCPMTQINDLYASKGNSHNREVYCVFISSNTDPFIKALNSTFRPCFKQGTVKIAVYLKDDGFSITDYARNELTLVIDNYEIIEHSNVIVATSTSIQSSGLRKIEMYIEI